MPSLARSLTRELHACTHTSSIPCRCVFLRYGYEYVNIDDCWAANSRDSNNMIQPNKTTFPDFQGMIDYVHSKGLKFGLYSDAGYKTCRGQPGSLGFEKEDANRCAAWKVDYVYLKHDNCQRNPKSVTLQ